MIFGTSTHTHFNVHASSSLSFIHFFLILMPCSTSFHFFLVCFVKLVQFIGWILKWDLKQRMKKKKRNRRKDVWKIAIHKSKIKWRKFGMCHTFFVCCYLLFFFLTCIWCWWLLCFFPFILRAHKHIVLIVLWVVKWQNYHLHLVFKWRLFSDLIAIYDVMYSIRWVYNWDNFFSCS